MRVASVAPLSPALAAGVRSGDVIVRFGRADIAGIDELLRQLDDDRIGVPTPLIVLRGAELREIPVIAVTAFAMKGDEQRIRQGGCEAYISKPISIGTFLETVRRYLGEE